MAEGAIFICYRREDSVAHAGRLYDRLAARFGKNRVFMDVDTIEPGEDFDKVIEQKIAACHALIAVIGKSWVGVVGDDGVRRLDNPEDYVRVEITAALKRDVRVIPALVGGAAVPRSIDLPDGMKALAHRNAIEISDAAFHQGVARLIETLEPRSNPRWPLWLLAATVVAVGALTLFALWQGRWIEPRPTPSASRVEAVPALAGDPKDVPLEAPVTPEPTAPQPKQPKTPQLAPQNSDVMLRDFRTMVVNATRARFFGDNQMKAALQGNKDFAALQIMIVDDPGVADVILEVGYTFAWDYPFSLTHQRTSVVLVSGKGVGPLSPSAGAGSVARELAKLLKPYRPSAP